ncbi:MAG: prolipoprotein diacylglyceryl transferase [Candidatus Magasanikbacteria bacterium]|nr:prolipoprotein diacylglyceryl transferase [Candidatus Magasanikbacteria bacterium]
MIPYFEFQNIPLGPIVIQVWGFFVALGIIAAITFAYFLCKKYLLSGEVILDMAIWVLVGAFVMARVFHIIFYNPAYYMDSPAEIIKFWHGGASSLGGFVGASVSAWLFAKKRRFTLRELLPYIDIAALGLWLGWGIGRIGCFLIHDHPGTLTSFVLGVKYPDGARFDLGLMESILGFVLFIIFYLLFKKLIKIHWGLVSIFSFGAYAVARFFLDFLRVPPDFPGGDARFGFLTPAQWGMVVVLVGLTLLNIFLFKKKILRHNSEV